MCEPRYGSTKTPVCVDPEADTDFEPFITDAFVSLVGGEKRVAIKLLRDTGTKNSIFHFST